MKRIASQPGRAPRSPQSRRGFTLVELMVAMAIAAIVVVVFHQVNIGTARTLFDSAAKMQINKDIRHFTGELNQAGRAARAFYLYPQFPDGSGLSIGQRRSSGQTGDLVVFMVTEPEPIDMATANDVQEFFVTKLVAYARVPAEGSQEGPVFRYEKTYPHNPASSVFGPRTSASSFSLEALASEMLSDPNTTVREVLQLSRGLADERLFFNFRGNSLIVNGEILHGNNVRRSTNTYNFTVTPRG